MEAKKSIIDKVIEAFMKQPTVDKQLSFGRITLEFMSNNAVFYKLDGKTVTMFHSLARLADGRSLDTRSAARKGIEEKDEDGRKIVEAHYEENRMRLTQRFELCENVPYFITTGILRDSKGKTVTNYIAPLDFAYPSAACDPLFLSLDQKMLLVPYDNDMWVRYESAPLRPGRTSYDVSAIYDESSNRGLVVGALDFDCWKNAIRCSEFDARCYTAFSGVADGGTHDVYPHGMLSGESVSSSRFVVGMYDDIRDGLEEFGRLAMQGKFAFSWSKPAPFGWNSYSALAMTLRLEHWKQAGDFIREELPNFCDENKVTYINLDANFGLNKKTLHEIIDHLHENGQMAGSYMAPLNAHKLMSMLPLQGSIGKTMKDIMMKDENGKPYHGIDSGVPVDITLPAAEKSVRAIIRGLVEDGFDYIKIDFTSHGGVEGKRHDPNVTTGRQALSRFYNILAEELNPEKIGREIFVDLSIAPLFPAGYGHGRRCCCDAFGHHEDVRYVLNALNFAWWTNGTLYCFNDPDHTVLQLSAVDGRGDTDFASARSRFNASVISGTVLLLSDNFGPYGDDTLIENSKERARAIANNPRINEIARFGKAFRPAYLKSDTTNAYYLSHEGRLFVALFNFAGEKSVVSVPTSAVVAPETGNFTDLNRGIEATYSECISVELDGYDSAILEIK